MTVAPVFVDAEGIVRDWINTLVNLVGEGNPLPGGAHLKHPRARSPLAGAYVLLQLGRCDDNFMTGAASRCPIYGQVYGLKKETAATAAVAYANALRRLDIPNTPMPTIEAPVAICAGIDNISGPLYAPDRQEERYLVDAWFYLQPA